MVAEVRVVECRDRGSPLLVLVAKIEFAMQIAIAHEPPRLPDLAKAKRLSRHLGDITMRERPVG